LSVNKKQTSKIQTDLKYSFIVEAF